MSDDEDDNGADSVSRIECRLGELELIVEDEDGEWVSETFEEKWAKRLEEAAEMKEAIRTSDVSAQ